MKSYASGAAALIAFGGVITSEQTVGAHKISNNLTNKHSQQPNNNEMVQLDSNMHIKQQSKSMIKSKAKQLQENESETTAPSQPASATDNIATANTEDMFAFSQILASGGKVSQVTAEMDKEDHVDHKQMDEDNAMLAFSYEMPGNDGEKKEVNIDTNAAQAEKQAQAQLDKLNSDDSTQALAMLAADEQLEDKLEKAATANTSDDKVEDQTEQAKVEEAEKNKKMLAAIPQKVKGLAQVSSKSSTTLAEPELSQQSMLELSTSVAMTATKGEKEDFTMIQIEDSNDVPLVAAQTHSLDKNIMDQLQKLNFSPEQIQYISQINQDKSAPENSELVEEQAESPPAKQVLIAEDPEKKEPEEQEVSKKETNSEDKSEQEEAKKPEAKKKSMPIDKLEKDQQPADNDDDEKLADNHRKMAKIDLKKEEIKKLEETHQALTKEAVKQQKIGASMKKVQHNLKIAKSVAKRVEDLKQQVQSDQSQLQQVQNAAELEPLLPFKQDAPKAYHAEVKNVPSIQDSSTGARHSPDILGSFLATKSQGMNVLDKHKTKKQKVKHSKKYYKDIEKARNQIKTAEDSMKKMDGEVKAFHNHMANSMSGLMQAFNVGFAALDKAKKEESEAEIKPEEKTAVSVNQDVATPASTPIEDSKANLAQQETTKNETEEDTKATQADSQNVALSETPIKEEKKDEVKAEAPKKTAVKKQNTKTTNLNKQKTQTKSQPTQLAQTNQNSAAMEQQQATLVALQSQVQQLITNQSQKDQTQEKLNSVQKELDELKAAQKKSIEDKKENEKTQEKKDEKIKNITNATNTTNTTNTTNVTLEAKAAPVNTPLKQESDLLSQGLEMKKSEAKDKKVEASPKKKEDKEKTEDKKPEKTENVQVSAEDKESQALADDLMADPGVSTDDLEKQAAQLVQQANEVMNIPDGSSPSLIPSSASPQDDSVVLTTSDDQSLFQEQANQMAGDAPSADSKAEIAQLLGKLKTLTGDKKGGEQQ